MTALLGPSIEGVRYGDTEAPTVYLAHPGILMRGDSKGGRPSWLERHTKEHIPALRAALRKLVGVMILGFDQLFKSRDVLTPV